jgi:hypothetical protein
MIAPVSEQTSSGATSEAPAEKAPDSDSPTSAFESFAGSYESRIWSHDEMRPGRTEFDGQRGGTYTFEQDGQVYTGELLDCEPSSPYQLACSWRDDFGAGRAALTFDEERSGFVGTWWDDGNEENPHPWIGVRPTP